MKCTLSVCAVTLLLTCPVARCPANDWPHWRGPHRNGIVEEPSGWRGDPWRLETIWKHRSGIGGSAPLVVGDRVYLLGWESGRDTLACLDLATGRLIWKQSYQAPRFGRHAVGDQGLYAGVCSTPEYDPATGLIYTLGIDGALQAWDTRRDGRPSWSLNLYDHFQAPRRPEVAVRKRTRRDYGYVSSPLVDGEQLIVEVGGKSGNLVGFDKRSGQVRWSSRNKDEAGHTGGPVRMTVEGVPCVAVLTLRNLVVTRIDGSRAGETVGIYPWTTDFGNNIATPAVFGDSVVITSAYNHYAMCRLRVSLQGVEKVWEVSQVASGVCSPIIHDGHIYWAWRGIHCLDFASGRQLWSSGNVGAEGSCIVTADDRLVVYANRGDLMLVETAKRSPERLTQLARMRVLAETEAWPHVVLAHGRIICRDRLGNVRCLAIDG